MRKILIASSICFVIAVGSAVYASGPPLVNANQHKDAAVNTDLSSFGVQPIPVSVGNFDYNVPDIYSPELKVEGLPVSADVLDGPARDVPARCNSPTG